MGSAAWWLLVLIVVVIAGFVGVVQVKRWTEKEESSGENFTISDLRRLHKAGKISTEEYEKARLAIVATMQQAQAKTAPPPEIDPLNPTP